VSTYDAQRPPASSLAMLHLRPVHLPHRENSFNRWNIDESIIWNSSRVAMADSDPATEKPEIPTVAVGAPSACRSTQPSRRTTPNDERDGELSYRVGQGKLAASSTASLKYPFFFTASFETWPQWGSEVARDHPTHHREAWRSTHLTKKVHSCDVIIRPACFLSSR
jgi:hypothetical protein